MSGRRQLGTRIDDSGELAEAWDEYKRDYENKSSAMRQLMRQGLELDEADRATDTAAEQPVRAWDQMTESLSIGAVVSVVSWLLVTAASLIGLLPVSSGVLVVSGIGVVGLSSTAVHLRASGSGDEE
jgi:hypothetical protein